MKQALIAVLMIAAFVAASLIALAVTEEVTSVSQTMHSDNQTR
jgi:hypothetical protein